MHDPTSVSGEFNESLRQPACDPNLWFLDPQVVYLNHGAFGSCPRHVLEHQQEWQRRLERQPLQFMVRELEAELDKARAVLAEFVSASNEDVVFIPNATTGVNTVLHSLRFEPGDELLVTNHEYNATRNALNRAAQRAGAHVVSVDLPFPFRHEDELVAPVLAATSSQTRLALLDHITSQTGVILPLNRIVRDLAERGIDTLIDGAHAPGMIPLDLTQLGATYYTGNTHKWLCTPKGSAFLYVHRDRQDIIKPLTTSHGANSPRTDKLRFQIEFAWTGTRDHSPWLSVPKALSYMASLMPGGWTAIMQRNRALALAGRACLCEALGVPLPCPDEYIGSLASVSLPDAAADALPGPPFFEDPLQANLLARHHIEVPIMPWPAPPKRVIRIAAQLYNSLPQYEHLSAALMSELN